MPAKRQIAGERYCMTRAGEPCGKAAVRVALECRGCHGDRKRCQEGQDDCFSTTEPEHAGPDDEEYERKAACSPLAAAWIGEHAPRVDCREPSSQARGSLKGGKAAPHCVCIVARLAAACCG